MVRSVMSIYHCEECLLLLANCVTYCSCPARSHREKSYQRVTALESLLVERLNQSGPVQEAIGQFVATCQLTSRPIAITHWDGVIGSGSDMPLALPYLAFP